MELEREQEREREQELERELERELEQELEREQEREREQELEREQEQERELERELEREQERELERELEREQDLERELEQERIIQCSTLRTEGNKAMIQEPAMNQRDGEQSELERFEMEAEQFYKDTGFLAPGKSEVGCTIKMDYDRDEVRRLLKRLWDKKMTELEKAVMLAKADGLQEALGFLELHYPSDWDALAATIDIKARAAALRKEAK